MPEISRFYGIVIKMFFKPKEHEPAVKVVENDLLYIIRGGMKWAVQGARVK